jgi:hypothetical protein
MSRSLALRIGGALLFIAPFITVRASLADTGRAPGVAVDFAPPENGSDWFVLALEELVGRELGRFHHIQLAEKLEARACPDRELRCLLDAYKNAGAAVAIFGELRGTNLRYQVYDLSSLARASDGSLSVSGVSSTTLRRHISEIIRPIVQRGGLVDQGRPLAEIEPRAKKKGRAEPNPITVRPLEAAPLPLDLSLIPPALLALIAFLALPCVLPRLVVRRERSGRREEPASQRTSIALGVLLSIALVAAIVRPLFGEDRAEMWTSPVLRIIVPVAGGALWGVFVLVNLGWVFAPIHGLSRVRHSALGPLVQSWLVLSILRATLLSLYAPIALLALETCRGARIPDRETFALVFPAIGLGASFWFLSVVDNLSAILDAKLVLGPATERNPWHATIKRYFLGYVRRLGVEIDPDLIDRALFLPTQLPYVSSYGGGFARPRILVGERIREAALGELPDEDEIPERTVNPDELPHGLLIPKVSAAGGEAERVRRELTKAPPRPRGRIPRLLGEHATLLGWVMPQPIDQSVPLIANTKEDFEVVKKLLTNHYSIFETNRDEDEIDDTDPSQRDLLFGAILRELGAVRRGDTLLATIRHSFTVALARASLLSRLLMRGLLALYDRFLSGPAATVADSYAALNHGLHHLIQYLAFLKGTDGASSPSLLTARADVPRLVHVSKEILDAVGRESGSTTEQDRQLLRATPTSRLLWLSQFFYKPLALRRNRLLRTAFALAFSLAAAALALSGAWNALAYHPTYVERMNRMQSEASASNEGAPR